MSFSESFARTFKRLLPSPFTIAIALTLFVIALGLLLPNNTPTIEVISVESVTQDSTQITLSEQFHYTGDISSNSAVYANADLQAGVEFTASNTSDNYESTYCLNLDSNSEVTITANSQKGKFRQLIGFWDSEMWSSPLLAFLVQMMLMLVLGHVLALSQPVDKLISRLTAFCTSNGRAVIIVSLLTIAVSLFNWGLGLIFGAVFARKVAEYASKAMIPISYPLIGAAGYCGLMVWHGGISGSAPIKISEEGSIHSLMSGRLTDMQLASIPDSLPFEATIFSSMNIMVSAMLLLIIPCVFYLISRKTKASVPNLKSDVTTIQDDIPQGAERLDHSRVLCLVVGIGLITLSLVKAIEAQAEGVSFNFINPNYINLLLLGLCFMFHKTFKRFLDATGEAIGGTTGILLQFPLYFGILGLMKGSGLMTEISDFFIGISTNTTYPIYTFFSAGIVNIFVPSGGGQWAVQGPIIIESASAMGVSLDKSIMAMAYGDQLTNMLQPFWALPLLGITGLKAKEILPYTLGIMLVGILIFVSALLMF